MTLRRALLVDASGCNRGKILAGPPEDVLAYTDFLMSVTGAHGTRRPKLAISGTRIRLSGGQDW